MIALRWEPVDSETADLLSLVANDKMHPRPEEEWNRFTQALESAADLDGVISPNFLRGLLRGSVAPRRIGAFTHRAKSEGLIVETGDWQISDDREGRNGGRPMRVYRLTDSRSAAHPPTAWRDAPGDMELPGATNPHPSKHRRKAPS